VYILGRRDDVVRDGAGRKVRRMVTADLLSRARAGDGEAFRELAESHLRELQVHCYRMLGSLQDAEDVVQETMLAAWQGIGGFAEQRASLRRHHADTLIVPMSLIRDAYRAQILGGLADGARRSCTSSWRRTPGRSGSGSTPACLSRAETGTSLPARSA
jgi:hypothetical protein